MEKDNQEICIVANKHYIIFHCFFMHRFSRQIQCFPPAFLSSTVFDLKIEFYDVVYTEVSTVADGEILKFVPVRLP